MFDNWDTDDGQVPALSVDQQIEALKRVIESVQGFALWLVIALAVVLIAAALIVKFRFPGKMRGFALTATGIVVGCAVGLISVILYMQISRMALQGEINLYFWLIVGLFAYLFAAVLANLFVHLFAKKAFKPVLWGTLALFAAYVVVILCLFPTQEGYEPKNNALYIVLTVVLVAAVLVLAVLFDRKKGSASDTKQLAYAGVCIATAFALSYVKFFSLPMGGSVTLVSMLPIMLYAYMFGAKRGVLVGVIYGLLQCIQSPQIYEPVQVLLDYPIAFGALGLAGIFKGMKGLKGNMLLEFVLGMVVACVGRYVSHVLSGYFVFYSWSVFEAGKELLYSLAYNAFIFVDLALDVLVGAALLSSGAMRRQIASVNPPLAEEQPEQTA